MIDKHYVMWLKDWFDQFSQRQEETISLAYGLRG
jgi:hypothetical protein